MVVTKTKQKQLNKEWYSLFEHEYVRTNGVNLHIVKKGNGPLIIFLHGFPEFWYSYRHQLLDFSKDFTAVAIDNRGYNESDKPVGVDSYRLEELVKDVKGIIEYLGFEKCTLVAHDLGGIIAWQLAYSHPEILDNLIILNCPHPMKYSRELKNPTQIFKSWYIYFFQLPIIPEFLISINNFQGIEEIFLKITEAKHKFEKSDLEKYRKMASKENGITSMLNYYRNVFKFLPLLEKSNMNKKLNVPTLIIWGEDDKVLSKSLTYDMGEFLSNFEIKYIPDCSHWVQQEEPELVNQYIREFLNTK
ncbi:MAG: alpha/beta hydrolase [Leptospiraceae bacterium]|nr:alpha/beta hydrolase [Leptospiraceae bacterium]